MTRVLKNKKRRFTLENLTGDCLEKAGVCIPNGAYAIVDHYLTPKPGDFVVCTKTPAVLNQFCKQVKTVEKDSITVGTDYADPSRNYEFEAAEIHGVVIEVYDRIFRNQIYSRKTAQKTIKGPHLKIQSLEN